MAELTGIESKMFTARDFPLENGQSLPVLELAYETYGTLAPAKDNAVLAVHGAPRATAVADLCVQAVLLAVIVAGFALVHRVRLSKEPAGLT